MLLTRFRSLLLVLGLLGGSGTALAQQGGIHQGNLPFPTASVTDHHDYQLFAPADLSEYGNGPQQHEGIFARYDRLMWNVSGPKTSVVGNPAAERVIAFQNANSQLNLPILDVNSLDNSFIQNSNVWGNRYELGYVKDDRGWFVSTFFLHTQTRSITQTPGNIAFADPTGITRRFIDLNGDGIDDDINGNGIFGNTAPFNADLFGVLPGGIPGPIFVPIGTPYQQQQIIGTTPPVINNLFGFVAADGVLDSYVGADAGDAVAFPLTFTTLTALNETQVRSTEIMHLIRWDPLHTGANVEWFVGVRYMNVKDIFSLLGTNPNGTVQEFRLNNIINNHMVGPQVGIRWNLDQGRWQLNTEARFTAAANFQEANMRGGFSAVGNQDTLDANAITAANFLSFLDQESSLQFSPIGEIRFDVGYKITQRLSLRVGYTGTLIGGITRASRRITYDLPGVFENGVATRGVQINDDNRLESFYMSGVNFGIEYNR
jgi:hypothetical protein